MKIDADKSSKISMIQKVSKESIGSKQDENRIRSGNISFSSNKRMPQVQFARPMNNHLRTE